LFLKVLYAHQTEISVIPDEVNQLISLEFLDVSHAKLTTIPKSIGDLSSLRVFVASHNQLETSSPRSKSDDENDNGPWDCSNFWENLVNVREVDLSYNKLKKIPVGLADFPRADVLLTGNPLSSSEKQSKSSLLNEYSEGKRFKVGLSETSGRRPEMEDRFLVRCVVCSRK
jgi:Leucine-rich repeat (LRR) protein